MTVTNTPIITSGDAGWDMARRAWNLAADQHPAAIALPRDPADVQAALAYAEAHGLRVTAQGTGHGAARLGPLGDTLLIRTYGMAAVGVDPQRGVARAEAGAVWGDVVAAASRHGLAALAGTAMDVGVAGYTLGGGIGFLARRHGLAANHVAAIELVTADGRLLRAEPDRHVDLFWALRGGGGGFGVVCALELELLPLAEVHAGTMTFPIARAGEVLAAWREWTAQLPDEVTTTARLMAFPPDPALPDPLRGRRLVVLDGADVRDARAARAQLEPLRRLGPELDTFAPMPIGALGAVHMDPPQPVPAASEHVLLDELSSGALDALVTAGVAALDAGLLMVEVRHLGGALARPAKGAGALSHLEGEYLVHAVGVPPEPGALPGLSDVVDDALRAVDPWRTDWAFPNFAERGLDGRCAYDASAARRLRAIKALADPADRFRGGFVG